MQDLVCGLQWVLGLGLHSFHKVLLLSLCTMAIISTHGTMENIKNKIKAINSLLVKICLAFSLNSRSTRKIVIVTSSTVSLLSDDLRVYFLIGKTLGRNNFWFNLLNKLCE